MGWIFALSMMLIFLRTMKLLSLLPSTPSGRSSDGSVQKQLSRSSDLKKGGGISTLRLVLLVASRKGPVSTILRVELAHYVL